MRQVCCVPKCNSVKNDNNSFHLFPRDVLLKKEWLKALKMKHFTLSMKVCSEHFTPENFFFPEFRTTRMKLKKGSVPSRNLPTVAVLKRARGNSKTAKARRDKIRKQQKEIKLTNDLSKCQQIIKATETISSISMDDSNKDVAHSRVKSEEEIVADKNTWKCKQNFEITEKIMLDKGIPDKENISKITVANLILSDEQLFELTGIKSLKLLDKIIENVENVEKAKERRKKCALSNKERIILTLMKLKMNITFSCLARLLRISRSKSQNYFIFTIESLRDVMSNFIKLPDNDRIMEKMPESLKNYFKLIVDFIEVTIAQPTCSKCKNSTYSQNKRTHTAKYLTGTTQSGLVSFLSSGYGGRLSNKKILFKSKILEKICSDNTIVVVKEFIENEELTNHINVIRLPIPSDKNQLYPEEIEEDSNIDTVVKHIKKFTILKNSVPCDLVSQVDSIMIVICGLLNLNSLTNEFI